MNIDINNYQRTELLAACYERKGIFLEALRRVSHGHRSVYGTKADIEFRLNSMQKTINELESITE